MPHLFYVHLSVFVQMFQRLLHFTLLLVNQQFLVTHSYTLLQETEKNLTDINGPAFKHVNFL